MGLWRAQLRRNGSQCSTRCEQADIVRVFDMRQSRNDTMSIHGINRLCVYCSILESTTRVKTYIEPHLRVRYRELIRERQGVRNILFDGSESSPSRRSTSLERAESFRGYPHGACCFSLCRMQASSDTRHHTKESIARSHRTRSMDHCSGTSHCSA